MRRDMGAPTLFTIIRKHARYYATVVKAQSAEEN